MTDSVDCARSATAEKALAPRSVAGIAAREDPNGAPRNAPQGLEKIESAPGNGSVSEASSHKIWYTGARLTVRNSGKNDKAAELQKKAPNALKSPDAELKSAPSHSLGAGANRSG